jgi:hypothetical protein
MAKAKKQSVEDWSGSASRYFLINKGVQTDISTVGKTNRIRDVLNTIFNYSLVASTPNILNAQSPYLVGRMGDPLGGTL